MLVGVREGRNQYYTLGMQWGQVWRGISPKKWNLFWDMSVTGIQCHYNAVNFHTNIHEGHPIPHPSGWGMGCLSWVQPWIDILLQFLQLFMSILYMYWTTLQWHSTILNISIFGLIYAAKCWEVKSKFNNTERIWFSFRGLALVISRNVLPA